MQSWHTLNMTPTTSTLTPATTCMTVLVTSTDAVYLRLPRELQRSANDGSTCTCGHCGGEGLWDTLVVPTSGALHGYSNVVHMPDSSVAGFREYLRKHGKLVESRGRR